MLEIKQSASIFVAERHKVISDKINDLSEGNPMVSDQLLSLQSQVDYLRAECISPSRSLDEIFSMIEDRLNTIAELARIAATLTQAGKF